VYGQGGTPLATVFAADDGGTWRFGYSNVPEVLAHTDPDARRKKDRFTSKHLSDLLVALGVPRLEVRSFFDAGRYALLERQVENIELVERAERRLGPWTFDDIDNPAFTFWRAALEQVAPLLRNALSAELAFIRSGTAASAAHLLERTRRIIADAAELPDVFPTQSVTLDDNAIRAGLIRNGRAVSGEIHHDALEFGILCLEVNAQHAEQVLDLIRKATRVDPTFEARVRALADYLSGIRKPT
jgi:hypothetical protein